MKAPSKMVRKVKKSSAPKSYKPPTEKAAKAKHDPSRVKHTGAEATSKQIWLLNKQTNERCHVDFDWKGIKMTRGEASEAIGRVYEGDASVIDEYRDRPRTEKSEGKTAKSGATTAALAASVLEVLGKRKFKNSELQSGIEKLVSMATKIVG